MNFINKNEFYRQEVISREIILKIEHYQVTSMKNQSEKLRLISSRSSKQNFKYYPEENMRGIFKGLTIKLKGTDQPENLNYIQIQIRNRSIPFQTIISSPFCRNQTVNRQIIPKKIVTIIDSFLQDDYIYILKGNTSKLNKIKEEKYYEITESMQHPQYLEQGQIVSFGLVQSFEVLYQQSLAVLLYELMNSTSAKNSIVHETDIKMLQGSNMKIKTIKSVRNLLKYRFPRYKTIVKSNQNQIILNEIIEFQNCLEANKIDMLFDWINEQKVLILKAIPPSLAVNYKEHLILFVDMNCHEEKFVLGRDGQCDIVIDNPQISRENSEIYFRSGNFYVKDGVGSKPSRNGSFALLQEQVEYTHYENQINVVFGNNKFKISVTPAPQQSKEKKYDIKAYL